jgi:hypothetical protein
VSVVRMLDGVFSEGTAPGVVAVGPVQVASSPPKKKATAPMHSMAMNTTRAQTPAMVAFIGHRPGGSWWTCGQ